MTTADRLHAAQSRNIKACLEWADAAERGDGFAEEIANDERVRSLNEVNILFAQLMQESVIPILEGVVADLAGLKGRTS